MRLVSSCFVSLALLFEAVPSAAMEIATDPYRPPSRTSGRSHAASDSTSQFKKPWFCMDMGGGAVVLPMSPTFVGFAAHFLGPRLEWSRGAVFMHPRITSGRAVSANQAFFNFTADLGGRYIFDPAPTSPFVGGGLWYGLTSLQTPKEALNQGGGAFAEAGYEFFRSKPYQLSLALRVDAPFYRVHYEGKGTYLFPISLELTISLPGEVYRAFGGFRL